VESARCTPFHLILPSSAILSQSRKSQGSDSTALSEAERTALASFNDFAVSSASRLRRVTARDDGASAACAVSSVLREISSRGVISRLASSTAFYSSRRFASHIEGNAPHIGPEPSSRRSLPPRVDIPICGDFPPMTLLRPGASRYKATSTPLRPPPPQASSASLLQTYSVFFVIFSIIPIAIMKIVNFVVFLYTFGRFIDEIDTTGFRSDLILLRLVCIIPTDNS